MTLDQVNIIGLQPFKVPLHTAYELVDCIVLADPFFSIKTQPADLGGYDKFLPPSFHRFSKQFLAVPNAIHICGIKKIDSDIQGCRDHIQ